MRWRLKIARTIAAGWLAVAAVTSVYGQAAAPVQESQRKTSTPYTGDLTIFDYPEREQKLHINQVMDQLGITAGKSVADIGAGSGWFTVRAAKRVTESGKVYAVDINPEAVAYVKQRADKAGLANVEAVLGEPDNPKLPTASVDSVLLLKTYHEVAKPVELMRRVHVALRPAGKVGIIDRNGSGENHGVAKKVVVSEMETAGFRLESEHDNLVKDDKMDYFLIFVAK